MSYIDYDYYISIYGEDAISTTDFSRLSWDACRKIDIATTGIDGIRKLAVAFPDDDYDAEAVKRCICKLVQVMQELYEAERNAKQAGAYVETTNGLRGGVISSISAGNESITYAVGSNNTSTYINGALADKAVQDQLYSDIIREGLSGIHDANGVSLLYMGIYPYRIRKD